MADFVQALALLFLAADFSHKPHRDIKCVACHTAVPASTRANDNLLPRAEVCRPCHAESTVRQTPLPRFVMKFSHAAHGKMLACQNCHRAAPEPAYPAMQFCIGCHNQIDIPDSCMKCHTPTQQLKPASHTTDFFDAHSSKRIAKTGCAVCHGHDFTCQGCH